MKNLEKSVYLFVYKGYYQRHHDLSRIVRDMQLFYLDRLTPDLIEYAANVYKSFLRWLIMDIKFNNILDLYNFSGAFRFEFSVLLNDCDDAVSFYIQRSRLIEIIYVYHYDLDFFDDETYIHALSVMGRFNWRSLSW